MVQAIPQHCSACNHPTNALWLANVYARLEAVTKMLNELFIRRLSHNKCESTL